MATVGFDGQSFSVNGRRTWLLGASVHYARIEPEAWDERLAEVRRAGFNLVETACPWYLHEPRSGRFEFEGQADLVRFVRLCGEHGLRVLLRPGPSIGAGYDGGGLPAWITDQVDLRLRESDPDFLALVNRYFRELLTRLVSLQATQAESGPGGPILLVQCEHAWHCANDAQGSAYLQELTRFIRECGINVPVITANDFWQSVDGAIETWAGSSDLLANLRQLHALQSHAPRIVSTFSAADDANWGDAAPPTRSPGSVLFQLGQVIAAGAQPVVVPLVGSTGFGFTAGRRVGRPDGFATTAGTLDPPITPAGTATSKLRMMRRLVSFAGSFSHVLADLDPSAHAITMDPAELGDPAGNSRGSRRGSKGPSIVPLRGGQGRIVFVFAGKDGPRSTTLLLESGVRMPIDLGDQPLAWYAFDVDLHGKGRLDYANVCPYAIVNRSILVLQGPARTDAFISINGSPLQLRVPGGAKPEVVEHQGVTIVLCNQEQIDHTIADHDTVFVGVDRLDADGAPVAANGTSRVTTIKAGPDEDSITAPPRGRAPATVRPKAWQAAPASDLVEGVSPRFASLDGPQTLADCGARTGYGWYHVALTSKSARKRLLHLPAAGDRLHIYVDGALNEIVGLGPGATEPPFELSLPTGDRTLVILADNMGRFDGGNDAHDRKGLFGHVYEVKRLRACKGKLGTGEPVDPFALRGFVSDHCAGQPSGMNRVTWSITHRRKAPLLFEIVDVEPSALVLLNGEPIAFYAGATGSRRFRLLLEQGITAGFKRGANEITVVPTTDDDAAGAFAKAGGLYECVETITNDATWSFARWEPPAPEVFAPVTANGAKGNRRRPCWWSASFTTKRTDFPMSVDVSSLSKGQVFVNDHNLGRYFTATATGKKVGPQTRLHLPTSWIHTDRANTLTIFDEHGFAPFDVRIAFGD